MPGGPFADPHPMVAADVPTITPTPPSPDAVRAADLDSGLSRWTSEEAWVEQGR